MRLKPGFKKLRCENDDPDWVVVANPRLRVVDDTWNPGRSSSLRVDDDKTVIRPGTAG
jgi:predicted Zn-dependent protease